MKKLLRRETPHSSNEFIGMGPESEPVRAFLPKSPMLGQQFEFSDEKISAYAYARKAKKKEFCQDSAVVFISKDLCFGGIFDGFYEGGLFYSRTLAQKSLELVEKRVGEISKSLDSVKLLKDAVADMLASGSELPLAGTTATIALLRMDGAYSVSCVGDSAAYVIGRKVKRLLDYDRFYDSKNYPKRKGIYEIKELGYEPGEYAATRSMLPFWIGINGISKGKTLTGQPNPLETAEGRLGPKTALVLASDGITKNLLLGMENDKVVEVSGSTDLAFFLRKERDPAKVGRKIIQIVNGRLGAGENGCVLFGDRCAMLTDDDISLVSLAFKP